MRRRSQLRVRVEPLRPSDVRMWVDLINEADRFDQIGRATTVEDALAKLRSPGYGYDHVLVAWYGSQMAGYSDLWLQSDERGIGGVTVSPRFRRRGIGSALLRRLVDLAVEKGAQVLDIPVVPRITAATALLRSAGFELRRYWWELLWLRHEAPPPPEIPPGIELRTYRPGEDDQAWIELDAVAFEGHWGSAPLTLEDIEALRQRSDFDPRGLIFAVADGKLVGQALARYNASDREATAVPVGRIEDVAVRPSYRGRGIGRALLLACMRYLWDRGCRAVELTVDTENEQALRLYEGLGFVRVSELHWYRRDLVPLPRSDP